ncbi:MAG: peptidoglycan-binding protein [Pseudomonadota bacterium]
MRDISLADLNAIGGRSTLPIRRELVAAINKYRHQYDVDTPKRMAMFIAMIAPETGNFKKLEENLNYSAKRLRQVWPKRFPTMAKARQYARNPKKLANYVYGNRLGNKGHKDAGWLFRGSGPMQNTGRYNFEQVQKATGLPVLKQPELLRQPDAGTHAAFVFWRDNNLNSFADRGDVKGARKRVNGGYHGLKHSRSAYKKALSRFSKGASSKPASYKMRRELQPWHEKIKALGFDIQEPGRASPHNKDAVMAFQRQAGLKVDGIIGPNTKAAIDKAVAAVAQKSAPLPKQRPEEPKPVPAPIEPKEPDKPPQAQAAPKQPPLKPERSAKAPATVGTGGFLAAISALWAGIDPLWVLSLGAIVIVLAAAFWWFSDKGEE